MVDILSLNYIPTSNINIITVYVTEPINFQYIKDFITTTLESNNISIDNNTYFWYKFIQQTNQYEIYVINSFDIDFDILPNILNAFYYDNEPSHYDLFIVRDFFALFENGKLFCFKAIKDSSVLDIKSYIQQTYLLEINNTYEIDDDNLKELETIYSQNSFNEKIVFKQLSRNKSFLFFSLFSVFCFVIFTYSIFDIYKNDLTMYQENLIKLENQYSKLSNKREENKKITIKTIELFKYISLENIKIISLKYKKKKLLLNLVHTKKANLLNLLTIYNKKIVVNSIEYLKDKKLYKMSVSVTI